MQLKSYPHYKNSGIAWLGDIPAHWEVKKLKYLSEVVLGKMLCNEDKGGYFLKPYLKSKNIQWLKVDISDVEEMWFSKKEMQTYQLKNGDLVLSEGGEVGKTCIWREELEECFIQNSAHKVTIHPIGIPEYYLYLFYLYGYKGGFESIVNKVSIAHLTRDKLVNLKCLMPSLIEQKAIAQFLDYKTEQIDRFIRQKKQLIALLNEQKAVIINDAVTKGLNPSAPMKPSGIEWLGDVPAHWEVRKTKHLFQLITDIAPPNNTEILLSIYTHYGVKPRTEFEERGNRATTTDNYWLVKKQDIIVNKLLAWMGAIGISEYNGVTSPAYDILRSKGDANPYYYHHLFRSPVAFTEFKRHSRGIMDVRLRLYFSEFGSLKLPAPPKEEQSAIVTHIESATAQLNEAIGTIEKEIALVQEYRTALISEAVTGKIDVRDF